MNLNETLTVVITTNNSQSTNICFPYCEYSLSAPWTCYHKNTMFMFKRDSL